MQDEIVLTVEADGTITVIGDSAVAVGLFGDDAKTVQVRRASNVQPLNRPLRVAFRCLRTLFGEKGRVAAWTRGWRCVWQADLAPSGGPVLGPFLDRQDAIRAEVAWLQDDMTSGHPKMAERGGQIIHRLQHGEPEGWPSPVAMQEAWDREAQHEYLRKLRAGEPTTDEEFAAALEYEKRLVQEGQWE